MTVIGATRTDTFGAVFDQTGQYRYRLWRRWDQSLPVVLFVMLNPSTADAKSNDPTISRCVQLAKSWGYGGIEVVNLFAFRSTRQNDLWHSQDPVGPANDRHIKRAAAHSADCVVAWGNLPPARLRRSKDVLSLIGGKKLFCAGVTRSRQPRHPLYLPGNVELRSFLPCEGLPG